MLDKRTLKRFCSKVNLHGPVQPHMGTPCWLWTAYCESGGHGQLYDTGSAVMALAHRVAYCIVHNMSLADIKGQYILHACDVPACVNPEHLRAGTALDNGNDQRIRQRCVGALNGRARLTEADVLAIRASAGTASYWALGQKYGVSESQIGYIIQRKYWKHLL